MNAEIRHFHLFAGCGGGARGFQDAAGVRVSNLEARMRCIGGVDVDPAAVRDFGRLVGVPGTALDLFTREQYEAFHGHAPPADWREAGPDEIRWAAGGERPHIVFTSSPCKGLSGLLSKKQSQRAKYQALNALTVRGVWLTLEAWADDPPEFILFENVPRIQTRGRPLLDRIVAMLEAYGYAVAETAHDCGEIGGLAQHRQRFLLVARHREKVPPFLYEPPRRRVRSVGEVLGELPLPDDTDAGGPMHRLSRLTWKTWVRLALIPAGRDWRALQDLAIVHHRGLDGSETPGVLRDFALERLDCGAEAIDGDAVPKGRWGHGGTLGVLPWARSSGTVTGRAATTRGAFSVADPRVPGGGWHHGAMGVRGWGEASGAVTGASRPTTGTFAVADPRPARVRAGGKALNNVFQVVRWADRAPTVTTGTGPSSGAASVADPRPAHGWTGGGKYRVVPWAGVSGTVIAGSTTGQGAFAVQDPRPRAWRDGREHYTSGGHYGVMSWDGASGTVVGRAKWDRGPWSVAEPRLPSPRTQGVPLILSLDGTWHRPLTTLELAALQGFPVLPSDGEPLVLDGENMERWRERIGNAVPPPAARAIAETMARTLLLAWSGQTFALSSQPVWVEPWRRAVETAVAVETPGGAA